MELTNSSNAMDSFTSARPSFFLPYSAARDIERKTLLKEIYLYRLEAGPKSFLHS